MYEAPDRQACAGLRVASCAELRAQGQTHAAECLERDWDDFTTFYDFPQEHWIHLRTSNPIESVLAGVRLRTDAAKRMRVRENVLYLVFKLAVRLSTNWRGINAPNRHWRKAPPDPTALPGGFYTTHDRSSVREKRHQ